MSIGRRSRIGKVAREYVAMVRIDGVWSAELSWMGRDRLAVYADLWSMCADCAGLWGQVRLYSRREWGPWQREWGWQGYEGIP